MAEGSGRRRGKKGGVEEVERDEEEGGEEGDFQVVVWVLWSM